MNNAAQPQPIPPADADMALLFLGSWFEKLLRAPERHQTTLDALAGTSFWTNDQRRCLNWLSRPSRRNGSADSCGW